MLPGRTVPTNGVRVFVYLCAAKGLCEQRCGQPRTSVPTGFERDRLFGAPPRDCANKDRDYSSVIDSHLRLVNATFPHKGRLWLRANILLRRRVVRTKPPLRRLRRHLSHRARLFVNANTTVYVVGRWLAAAVANERHEPISRRQYLRSVGANCVRPQKNKRHEPNIWRRTLILSLPCVKGGGIFARK